MTIAVTIPHDDLAAFCQRHHIRKLALFGSVLHGDFGPHSDVDVLVEFEPGHVPGWEIVALEDELGAMLARTVDLRTPEELSPHWRQNAVESAQVIYE